MKAYKRRGRGPCANPDCTFDVIGKHAYHALAPEDRDPNVRPHGGHGRCGVCHGRMRRNGTYEIQLGPGRPVPHVAEDWAELVDRTRSQAENVRALAPRFGMTEAALERAVLRAKRRGLLGVAA